MSTPDRNDIPPIHFAPARGGRLAYQIFGQDGPPTIVAIPPLAQNIELAWEWPAVRAMLERFGSFSRYLCFDKRGTGCSDRRSQVPGLDERVDDLRAVMDHAGIGSAHLFGASEGGAMTLLFAATYPERVESVILSGSYAYAVPDGEDGEHSEERRERQAAFAMAWGTSESPVVDLFAPSLASDQAFRDWHQRYERYAASSDSLRDLLELSLVIDVREILPTLDVPTLILHRTGDQAIPVEWSREMAAAIPGATLIEQDGIDHFNYVGDMDGWMDDIERFVTGTVQARSAAVIRHGVRIRTLGGFGVAVDGEDVPTSEWGSRRARQLCKRLVAARGWPVTRDELVDLLWPGEFDMRKLGARLSVQLSAVRRVLRGGVIADRETVRLDLDEVTTDLEAFHKATDDAAVVAAYTGEFLPEDHYEDWTAATRDEARARFVLAARRVAEQELAAGRHGRAAELGYRLIESDRYDEGAHRLVVTALVAAGERAEAERAHQTWVTALAELDVDAPPLAEVVDS